MDTPSPTWAAAAGPSRREFLATCALLALAAGCRSLAANSRSTYALIHDPHPDDYGPIVRGLIEAVLPFEDPRFPRIRVESIQERLSLLFPFEEEERYAGLQKAFVLFDDVALFPRPAPPIVDAEWEALDSRERDGAATPAVLGREKRAQDQALYEAFVKEHGTAASFHRLPLAAGRRYLQLWGASAFLVRRQFYRSVKSLVMIAAYSHPVLWKAIGYDGDSVMPDPRGTT